MIALNKIDLVKVMRVNPSQLERDAKKINPHAPFIKTNALSGMGTSKIIKVLGLKT
jgi:Ni2+-binding GTPase involved in maturation of urease and hydrogenase